MLAMNDRNRPIGSSSPRPAALALLAVAIFLVAAHPATAATITTYAGGGANGNFSNTIGFPATNAFFPGIQGVAVDLLGNLYIAHFTGHRVLRVDHTNGLLTSFAGTGVEGHDGDGGPATDAQLNGPMSVAVDLSGNVFVADAFDSRVRKIDAATGIITTVAGRSGDFGWTGDGGPATNASLSAPEGVAVDVHGNLYIADTFNFEVRKVDAASGIIHTIAGQFSDFGYTGDGGPATNALLNGPTQVAVDLSGNLFILDTSGINHIRRIDAQTGIITTVAGGGAGDGASGSATNANLNSAQDLDVDAFGGLYIGGDSGVWKVDLASGNISIVVGVGGTSLGFSGDGGPATNAMVNGLFGIAVSGTGDLYLADVGNDRVRKVNADRGRFAVNWFKIAGGGGGSGGIRPLVGTIGQADAGGPLTGARFSVVGGFWALPVVVQVPGAPTLKIVRASPGFATFSWTPNTLGFVLQQASSLSPADWTNAPSGATNPITVPAGSPAKFYRLTKP